MAESIVQKILERIDEREKPRSLDSRDVRDCPGEDLKELVERGVLIPHTFNAVVAVTSEYVDDVWERKVSESPLETSYEIVFPRILDAIRKDNILKGNLRDIEGRLFELGKRTSRGFPPIRVYLSLRNQDRGRLESVCDLVRRGPKNPAALLVPRWVLISENAEQQNDSRGLALVPLSEILDGKSWILPWKSIFVKLGRVAKIVPMSKFQTPAGARWEDVSIRFKDGETVAVGVKSMKRTFNYTQMGMNDSRTGRPTEQWDLLRRFSENRGYLTWGVPGADRKNKKRKYRLKQNLQRFFGIKTDPFRLIDNKKGWQARFYIEPD